MGSTHAGTIDEIDFTPLVYSAKHPPLFTIRAPSRAASPLIQRNSRRLPAPLHHCFMWEETRTRGAKEGVYREIRNGLSYGVLFLFSTLILLPSSIAYLARIPLLPRSVTRGSIDIEFRSMHLTELFFFASSRGNSYKFPLAQCVDLAGKRHFIQFLNVKKNSFFFASKVHAQKNYIQLAL